MRPIGPSAVQRPRRGAASCQGARPFRPRLAGGKYCAGAGARGAGFERRGAGGTEGAGVTCAIGVWLCL